MGSKFQFKTQNLKLITGAKRLNYACYSTISFTGSAGMFDLVAIAKLVASPTASVFRRANSASAAGGMDFD